MRLGGAWRKAFSQPPGLCWMKNRTVSRTGKQRPFHDAKNACQMACFHTNARLKARKENQKMVGAVCI